jgi:hypothetical protein
MAILTSSFVAQRQRGNRSTELGVANPEQQPHAILLIPAYLDDISNYAWYINSACNSYYYSRLGLNDLR